MKKYGIVEIFDSIQGEGFWTGTPCTFVRFAGCNMWSGHEKDRGAGKSWCAQWCDTDFLVREKLTGLEILERVNRDMVVLTGGEPLLQVDAHLLACLSDHYVTVETNGSLPLPFEGCHIDWVTCSPKVLPKAATLLGVVDELKLVHPCPINPEDFAAAFRPDHKFLQPIWGDEHSTKACLDYIQTHPQWRLSVQVHKVIGVL